MEKNLICEREYLIRLIQFLSFLRSFKGLKEYLGNQIDYLIEFPVVEFMNFLNVGGKYQRIKTLEFLRSLQKLDPIVTNFSETSFRSSDGVIFRNNN